MTPLRTIALTTAVALPLGVLISQVLPPWREEPDVRRECIAFVDALTKNPAISPHELHQELVGLGVTLPTPPSLTFPPRYSGREAEALLREYVSAKKAYEAKLEEVQASPEYLRAREAILSRNRDELWRACLSIFGGGLEIGTVPQAPEK
jgi:hypothetical protein